MLIYFTLYVVLFLSYPSVRGRQGKIQLLLIIVIIIVLLLSNVIVSTVSGLCDWGYQVMVPVAWSPSGVAL